MKRSIARSSLVAAFAGWALACSTPPTTEPAMGGPATAKPVTTTACSALPVRVPPDAVVTFIQQTVPHDGPGIDVNASLAVTDAIDGDPPSPAWLRSSSERRGGRAQLTQPELEALFAAFRERRFERMAAARVTRSTSPHYGGRYLVVRWPGHVCEVGDDALGTFAPGDEAAFEQLVTLTTARYETARARGTVRGRREAPGR